MAQQTAVEYILGEFKKYTNPVWTGDEFIIKIQKSDMVTLIEQAKQMEKEQIIEAFKEGYINGALEDNEYKGDDYFNETFEK